MIGARKISKNSPQVLLGLLASWRGGNWRGTRRRKLNVGLESWVEAGTLKLYGFSWDCTLVDSDG